MNRTRHLALVASIAVISSLFAGAPLSAPAMAASTPPTSVQVWDMNMHKLSDPGWRGIFKRMLVNQFIPDVITLQQVERCDQNGDPQGRPDMDEFMAELRATFLLTTWDMRHAQVGSGCGSDTSVIWNDDRFSLLGTTRWTPSSCALDTDSIAVNLMDSQKGSNLVVASLHLGASGSCLGAALTQTDFQIENNLTHYRPMTIIGGDLNERPDKHGETIVNGLESDPNCWYRGFSPVHPNTTAAGESCGSPGGDRYYDTVWLHPGSGGGINPAVTSLCQQYTKAYEIDPLDDNIEVANSCTDVNSPEGLDRSRIDYIWVSWEDAEGRGRAPTVADAQTYVTYASADLGLDVTSANRYSDHRAVQAVVDYWPRGL